MNLAILAEGSEVAQLDRLADGILADINGFVTAVFSCLSVGGKNSYEIDVERFTALLSQTQTKENKRFFTQKKASPLTAKDLLRFGVYRGSWDYASKLLGTSMFWKRCPKQMLDESTFEESAYIL